MKLKAPRLAWISIFALACQPGRAPAPLFESRVPLPPLLAKLKEAGGDPSKILHPTAAGDLRVLESGKRYKFVVQADGRMAIAPLPADAPSNEYAHPVLGEGKPARTAGGIRLDREGATTARLTVDQNSQAYCPSAASLGAALEELVRLGVTPDLLRTENQPPRCVGAPPPPESPERFGALMAEMGTRFERMGRAAEARRTELAAFELGEIGEIFADDVPKAEAPMETNGVNLTGVAQAFAQTNIPDLKAALQSRDPKAFTAAYARAAEACNGCHRSSGHAFIEIPTEPGRPVPRLDPRR
jgi:hypothetical protein